MTSPLSGGQNLRLGNPFAADPDVRHTTELGEQLLKLGLGAVVGKVAHKQLQDVQSEQSCIGCIFLWVHKYAL